MQKILVFVHKKWIRITGLILVTLIIMYTMIYFDVVARARERYFEGEKYWQWHENVSLKKQMLDQQYDREKTKLTRRLSLTLLDRLLGTKSISKEEYDRQLAALRFDIDRQLNESSIKYAYIEYQTVVELFTPPESKWVKLARQKMPVAKEMWKEELRNKGIPFEDYMID